jgi:integrase
MRLRVYGPEAPLAYLGDEPLEDIRRADLQDLIARLIADGSAPRTVEATIIPLRAIFHREIQADRLKVNPTAGLAIPRGEKARDRIADPTEARALLAAPPDGDRATWGTAMYAGLRRGELMALRVNRIDLDANVIRVEFGWDAKAGEIPTKNGKPRIVPIPTPLRELLLPHLLRTGRRDDDLVFGSTATEPFNPKDLTKRADAAWTELRRITLHECRAHVRQLHDRGRGEREGAQHVHGARRRGWGARCIGDWPAPVARTRPGSACQLATCREGPHVLHLDGETREHVGAARARRLSPVPLMGYGRIGRALQQKGPATC